MFDLCKKAAACSFLMLAGSAFAGTTTLSFSNVSDGGTSFNEFQIGYGTNQTLTVSAWSDTKNNANSDPYIERVSDIDKYIGGWSVENQDETSSSSCGYGHSADNISCSDDDWTDYDFFLLEFSEAVTLTEASFSWITGINTGYSNYYNSYYVMEQSNSGLSHQNAVAQNEVSFAAITDGTAMQDNTFSNIIDNQTVNSGSSEVMNNHNFNNGWALTSSTSYYADVGFSASSTTWIVSAFNSMFGSEAGMSAGDDGFKLSGISFTTPSPKDPPTEVPEPATIFMMAGALTLLARKSLLK